MVGLPIVNGNILGSTFQGLHNPIGRYFYDMIFFVPAAGGCQQFQCLLMKYLHADLRQDVQRGLMDLVLLLI